jgi:murein DD-endopeptidase MepM/ murein hydrolase activator NlpD
MGSAWAKHSDVLYRFPFAKGAKIPVSQGFNGKASHRGKNAIDFAVNINTPIYAARAGKVIALQESHNRGKYDKSYSKYANYLIIEHSDKTLAKYYHLRKDGVVPILSQEVKEGELIAYSGNTGYTSGPHLHFSVSTVNPNTKRDSKTIAIRFKNGGKMVYAPKKGDIITVH